MLKNDLTELSGASLEFFNYFFSNFTALALEKKKKQTQKNLIVA